MQERRAGASDRAIAETLTDERASAYADANGMSVERAMTQIVRVSTRTVWDDVTAEMEDLRRETAVQRSDLRALAHARLAQDAGSGLIAGGVLLATRWADPPVAERLTGSKALGHVHTASRRRGARRPHSAYPTAGAERRRPDRAGRSVPSGIVHPRGRSSSSGTPHPECDGRSLPCVAHTGARGPLVEGHEGLGRAALYGGRPVPRTAHHPGAESCVPGAGHRRDWRRAH